MGFWIFFFDDFLRLYICVAPPDSSLSLAAAGNILERRGSNNSSVDSYGPSPVDSHVLVRWLRPFGVHRFVCIVVKRVFTRSSWSKFPSFDRHKLYVIHVCPRDIGCSYHPRTWSTVSRRVLWLSVVRCSSSSCVVSEK